MMKSSVLFLCTGNSRRTPKAVNRFLGQRSSYVVTLCDRRKETSCPIFPGAIWRIHWDLEDPSQAPTPGARRETMRRVRDEIQQHVMDFVKNNGMTRRKEQLHEPRGERASI